MYDHSKGAREAVTYREIDSQTDYPGAPSFNKPSASTQKSQQRRFCGILHGWWWEVLAALLSWLSLAGVIGVLCWIQDQPQSKWPVSIPINTAIAALVTMLKSLSLLIVASCLGQIKWTHFKKQERAKLDHFEVFDEASRGPWGAFRLLWCSRLRLGWVLAVIGALITIAAVSVDALAQGIIRIEQEDVLVDSGNATFQIAHSYTGGAVARPAVGSDADFQPSSADVGMQGAIYRGMHGIPSNPPFECSSKCEWNYTRPSLAFRSRCEDVTSSTWSTKNLTENYTGSKVNVSSGRLDFTTPHGIILGYEVSHTSFWTSINVTSRRIMPQKFAPLDPGAINETAFTPEFARIAILRLKDPTKDIEAYKLEESDVEMFECTMGFVAHRYRDVKSDGSSITIQKTEISELDPAEAASKKGPDPVTGLETGMVIKFKAKDLDESFNVPLADYAALGTFFASRAFSGRTTEGESGSQHAIDEEIAPGSMGAVASGLSLTLLEADVQKKLDDTAQSMTHQLQGGFERNYEQQAGQETVVVAYVRVRWGWIAAPLAIVIATGVLLIASIWSSRQDVLWKLSALAVLYHDVVAVDKSAATLQAKVQNVDEVEKSARKLHTRPSFPIERRPQELC